MTSIPHALGLIIGTSVALSAHSMQSCDEDVVTFSAGPQGWIGSPRGVHVSLKRLQEFKNVKQT